MDFDILSLIDEDPLSRRENEVGPVVMPGAIVVTVVEVVVLSLHFLLRLLVRRSFLQKNQLGFQNSSASVLAAYSANAMQYRRARMHSLL